MAQACMYDYCIHKRDEQLAECEDLADDWEAEIDAQDIECKKFEYGVCLKTRGRVDFAGIETTMFKKVKKEFNKRPGWGQVYDYDNMHNELKSNGGDWDNATCDAYYAAIDVEY